MNNWREQVVTKEYITFGDLYDSFPAELDPHETGNFLDKNTPERYKKILFDFVDKIYDIYGDSVVFVFSYYDVTRPEARFFQEKREEAARIAWWLVRSCDKYAEGIYQYQKILDDSKLDKISLTSSSKSSSSELPLNSEDYDNPTATSSGTTTTESRLPVDNYLQIKTIIEDFYSRWLYEFEQKFVYNIARENLI